MLGCATHGHQFIEAVCTKCRDTASGQSTEIDRLRAELAGERAMLSTTMVQNLRAELAERTARAERAEDALKEQLETKKWYTDRAERAEAERDALREVLDRVVAKCPKLAPVCIAAEALAALAPSPKG